MDRNADVSALQRCEQRRSAAVVARDLLTLSEVLHDRLVYVHATGSRNNKSQLMDFIASGPRFLSVALEAPEITLLGDAALVVGELCLTIQRDGEAQPVLARSWASALWQRDAAMAGGWRLRHFQSTRMAA